MTLGYRDKRSQQFANGEFVRAFQGTRRRPSTLCARCRAIGWKRCEGTEPGNIQSVSISNGACASLGRKARVGRAKLKSLTITEDRKDNFLFMRAVHPGEVLKQELKEVGVAPTEFARQIDVPPNRVSQIIAGKRSVTGDTALRLGHWFGTDPQFWLNLQSAFDLRVAQQEVGGEIARLPVRAGASA
jgi:addiction module HigA family antidote